MNKKKFICILIFCLIVFSITLRAAFTVKSRVEINFILQTDIRGSLDELWLIEKSGLFYKADIVNKQQICFADVKPGTYSLQLAKHGENPGSAVYEKKIIYDPNLEKITSYIRCMNQVTVKSNKNLIIKITIKKSDMESHFGDIQEHMDQFSDEVDLTYYLQPIVPQSYKISKNGPSSQSLMNAAAQNRSQTISIDKLCEFDSGNISVKIDQAHIVDLGVTENAPAGGDDGVGVKEGDNIVLGKVRIISNKAIKKEAQSICDEQKKKCVSHFVFDVEVQLKTVLWNKDDMCAAVGKREEMCSGNKKYFYLSDPFNCSCEYDAVKVHEEKHFQLWIEAMNKLKAAECNDIFQYTVANDCDECTDCNIDETKVSSAIENKLSKIYSQANGDLQENACDLEEKTKFKQCVRCR